jgi:hypothetical protein
MSQKIENGNLDEENIDNDDENELALVSTETDPESHSAKKSKRTKQNFTVTGNPLRLLWKNVAWSICEQDVTSKWERAVIGSCCGHRRSMLEVANSWEDKVNAYKFHLNK